MREFQITHHIVTMKRGETSGSKSPLWRCTTQDNERVNIFQHSDPSKDSAHLFADYLPDMLAMALNQEMTWKEHPIPVQMIKNGQWWEVVAAAPRPADAQPDPVFIPNRSLHRAAAMSQAVKLVYNNELIIWDVETSGLGKDDEIISIAAIDTYGQVLVNSLVKPEKMERVQTTVNVHGITPEQLEVAPSLRDIYHHLCAHMEGKIWVVYNASYDPMMLEFNLARHNLQPFQPIGITDAMKVASWYCGEWNTAHQSYTSMKLVEVATRLEIPLVTSHNALADCLTTLAVLKKIAAGE